MYMYTWICFYTTYLILRYLKISYTCIHMIVCQQLILMTQILNVTLCLLVNLACMLVVLILTYMVSEININSEDSSVPLGNNEKNSIIEQDDEDEPSMLDSLTSEQLARRPSFK